jgi:hypothetical protein
VKKSLLTQCLSIAREYIPKHPQYNCFLHYSFIIQDNTIVEWSTNRVGVPPIHMGYHTRIGAIPKLHAEILAYRKAKGLLRDKFEIVNIRLNKDGELRSSKPCLCCQNILSDLGCIKFYYSYEGGFLKS